MGEGVTPTFEDRYIEICYELDKRRKAWDLAVLPWDDARQIILIHIHRKYHLYRPAEGEFSHWVNAVITNRIKGLWRDKYTNHARPCVLGCAFNVGLDACSETPSGQQCSECPLYRDWERRRKAAHDVHQTLPLETHIQEVSNQQGDFVDVAGAKAVIDRKMKEKLTKQEWRIYRALIIQGKPEPEVAKLLGPGKRKRKGRMYIGYQQLLKLRHRFVALARDIIEQEGLA